MCLNIGPAPLVQALCPTLPAANDLQLLDAEGLQGDGAFRLGLELRQPARLARWTIPPPPNINNVSTLHNQRSYPDL